MKENLASIILSKKDTLQNLIRAMDTHNSAVSDLPSGIILVVDEDGKLVGIVTDGDIRRAISQGVGMDNLITEVMNTEPFCVTGPRSQEVMFNQVAEALRAGTRKKRHFEKIVVVDADGRPLDVVSFYDLWMNADMRSKKIGVVGLGFVGLTLALTLADLGFDTVGYDKNAEMRKSISRFKPPFFEAGLENLLRDHLGDKFKIVGKSEDLNKCDVYIIAVGTPLDKNLLPQMDFIVDAARKIGRLLKRGDTVILRSTVPIGTTRDVVAPILEEYSGLTVSDDFFLVFAPERTVEGRALQELRVLPQVIGGVNRASCNVAVGIFNLMTDSVFLVDTLEEAEIVKLINNTYRDVNFAFANEVALICRKWGIETNKVINAANMGYERSAVSKPSPGVGGYCLEKDPYIFIESARSRGYEPRLIADARKVNRDIVLALADDIASSLKSRNKDDRKVFILGMAFKGNPPTSDMRGSSSVQLARELARRKVANVTGFDPLIASSKIIDFDIKAEKRLEDGFARAAAVVVMTNHPDFIKMNIRTLMKKTAEGATLFDPWVQFSREEVEKVASRSYKSI